MMWTNMFHLDLSLAEKMLRPVLVYVFLVVSLRLAGKRELAQLNPFDLVVLLTLSNAVQNAIIGDDNTVTGGLLGAATLLLVNYLVVRLLYRHPALDHLIEGDPDVLIENGQIRRDRCERELITLPELETAAHKQGFASLDESIAGCSSRAAASRSSPRSRRPRSRATMRCSRASTKSCASSRHCAAHRLRRGLSTWER